MNNKLIKTVTNYEMLQDEFKRNQALLVDAAMRENQLRKEQVELGEKLKETHQEEQKLCCCIETLQSQNNEMMKSLNSKDRKYELASSQVDELKSAAKSQLCGAQQEIKAMKNEVRRLSQDRSTLKLQVRIQLFFSSKFDWFQIAAFRTRKCNVTFAIYKPVLSNVKPKLNI